MEATHRVQSHVTSLGFHVTMNSTTGHDWGLCKRPLFALSAQLAYEMQTSKADSFMANMKPCAQSPLFGELPPSCFLIASMTNFSFLVSSTVVKDLVLRAYAFLHLNKETKAIQLK